MPGSRCCAASACAASACTPQNLSPFAARASADLGHLLAAGITAVRCLGSPLGPPLARAKPMICRWLADNAHAGLDGDPARAQRRGAGVTFGAKLALARTVGWISQWKEMIEEPELRIGRPRQLYTGAAARSYAPVNKRK